MIDALDGITPCITAFRRPVFLKRAVTSCVEVGFRRIVIASMKTTRDVENAINDLRSAYPEVEFIVSCLKSDPGCNEAWLRCGYMCPTQYMILLHDDDWLSPKLADHLEDFYALLEKEDVGGCTWRADAVEDDDSHRKIQIFSPGTRKMSSAGMVEKVMAWGHASISPVISVLRRDVLIHACKEADLFFDSSHECWHNPGMPYGTEIIVYFRHAEKYSSWYYVDEVLSFYGSHMGSGTIEAERTGNWNRLIRGYDLARTYCLNHRGPSIRHRPRIIFTWDPFDPGPGLDERRYLRARVSREMIFEMGKVIPVPFEQRYFTDARDLGDKAIPYLKDILDFAAGTSMEEDYVCYTNTDICPIISFEHRMRQLFEEPRRSAMVLTRQTFPARYMVEPPFSEIRNGLFDNGVDGLIFKKPWWEKYRGFFPNMLVGREAWDTVMRALVQETHPELSAPDVEIPHTLAHQEHDPFWRDGIQRRHNPGQRYNIQLAKNFFASRNRTYGWVDGTVYSHGIPDLQSI